MSKIGVFDSGVGGLSVVHAIENAVPEHEIIFANDTKNVPYGTKSPQELLELVVPILKSLEAQGCDVIVVACNTVTTTLIEELRAVIGVPLIGMEPMVKPAVQKSKSKTIAIFATPTTLASKHYNELKSQYANDIEVLEPDCSDWSHMIESDQLDRAKVENITKEVCSQGADIIVLGCTHYHWIEDIIRQATSNKAEVLQPEQPVISQLSRVLARQT